MFQKMLWNEDKAIPGKNIFKLIYLYKFMVEKVF